MMTNYRVFKNNDGLYGVLVRVDYPSGDLAFWQQVSKSYFHKKNALKILDKLAKKF